MKQLLLAFILFIPVAAWAQARSGSSFGGRSGFRSSSGGGLSSPRGYGYGPSRGLGYGSGTNVIVMPGLGWGFGGMGYGGGFGSFGLFGTLMMIGVAGVGAFVLMRAARRARTNPGSAWYANEGNLIGAAPDRAFVYQVQLALGRSARSIQDRLARFAAEGDTASEAGLASLLQQTALELVRHKPSIRYASAVPAGPMSLTNGESRMNAAALAERSRFQVERVRGSDGTVRKASEAATQSADALEYIVVTIIVATRGALDAISELQRLENGEDLDTILAALGAVPQDALLGLEVIWTPADPGDALTGGDLLTSYPDLRSL